MVGVWTRAKERQVDLIAVPEALRDDVAGALSAAFGSNDVSEVCSIAGGASGALTYRVETSAGPHFLRVEALRGPLRNPHQYECMQIAAEAEIAPPIRYVDADGGVVIMPFVEQRPLADYPGGPAALASAVGALLARLHSSPTFPAHGDYMDNLSRILGYLDRSGRVAPGLLARHAEGFERIRAAHPWQPGTFVSAHNDPNQFNVLYDGDRLWLVDWETASRNDPLVDVATASSHAATTPELRDVLLRSWLGHEPDPVVTARVALMSLLVHLWAGCILLSAVVDPANSTHHDLDALTMEEFGRRIESGEYRAGTPVTTHAYAKIALRAFVDGCATVATADALRRVAAA
jgi:aminoglycoside phosphotransferase (APT) family kinase protein